MTHAQKMLDCPTICSSVPGEQIMRAVRAFLTDHKGFQATDDGGLTELFTFAYAKYVEREVDILISKRAAHDVEMWEREAILPDYMGSWFRESIKLTLP